MARLETWYKQDLKRPLVVHKHTDVFNQDSKGNLIGVEVYSDGEPVVLAGSISGYCLLADGTTVPAVGASLSGNKASVLIPQTAYSVPGPITITIKNVDGENIATLCATVGIVRQSVSGNLVNPGSVVTDWSNDINAQLQAVQTAVDNVGAIVAAPFNENTVYVVGNYVTYNGNLYRITADHASGVAWADTTKTRCTVGSELYELKRTAVPQILIEPMDLGEYPVVKFNVTDKTITLSSVRIIIDGVTYTVADTTLNIPDTTNIYVGVIDLSTSTFELRDGRYRIPEGKISLFTFRWVGTGWNLTPVYFAGTVDYGYDDIVPYYQSGYFARQIHFYPASGEYINFDTLNRKIKFPSAQIQIYDKAFSSAQQEINIASSSSQVVVFNTKDLAFRCLNWNASTVLSRYDYLFFTFRFGAYGINADIGQVYTIDGRAIYGIPAKIVPSYSGNIDFDITNNRIVIPNDVCIMAGNKTFASLSEAAITVPLASTSAQFLLFNTQAKTFRCVDWSNATPGLFINECIIMSFRIIKSTKVVKADIPTSFYTINGLPVERDTIIKSQIKYVMHRGGTGAPENTMPAFRNAYVRGAKYIETDIQFTSDNVPVLLHDDTINRTARNADGTELTSTVYINDITYEQALTYDFGIYYGETFDGTKIPTLQQLLAFAKATGVSLVLELKTNTNMSIIVNLIKAYKMEDDVAFLSTYTDALIAVASGLDNKNIPLIALGDITVAGYDRVLAIKPYTNYPILGHYIGITPDENVLANCIEQGIDIDFWTVNSATLIPNLPTNAYTYITTDVQWLENDYINTFM